MIYLDKYEHQSGERQSINGAVIVRDGGESAVGPNKEDSAEARRNLAARLIAPSKWLR